LLEWRGSGVVAEDPRNATSLSEHGRAYNFNLAAKHDIPDAINQIRHFRRHRDRDLKVDVVGFCMGSAVLAESIARGHITDQEVECIVLMTLGLFYEAPIDGRLKCEDRVLERLQQANLSGDDPVLSIDPRVEPGKDHIRLRSPWHQELDRLYASWPNTLKSHPEPNDSERKPDDAVNHMCNRLSFMYGMPYHHSNLVNAIHGADSGCGLLPNLFGPIPLHMFIHGAQNIRKGYATVYRTEDDRKKDGSDDDKEQVLSEDAREKFRRLKKVTLITGALDRLWHRDSIDLMHEWLCRGTADHMRKFQKHILPKYAHQDLLWGTESKNDVFPRIVDGLEPGDYRDIPSRASRHRRRSHGIPKRDDAASPRV
jgi:hypothetical protein